MRAPNTGKRLGFYSLRVRAGSWWRPLICHRVEAVEGTWLSAVTKSLGWDYWYSMKDGYGAYKPSVVIPFSKKSNPPYYGWGTMRRDFDPDKIEPGDQFLIRQTPEKPKKHYELPPFHGHGRHNTTFEVAALGGAGVGTGLAVQSFALQIRNFHTKNTRTYRYSGLGVGGGISFVRPSGWTKVDVVPNKGTLKLPIDVDDFWGWGRVTSFGLGRSGVVWEFDSINGKMIMESWEVQAGGEADIIGYWSKE